MEQNRVKTPPTLNWAVISLPGSSEDEQNDEDFPFETIASAVNRLQTIVCNEWTCQTDEDFKLKRRSVGFEETLSLQIEDKNSLAYVCTEIKRNMKEIVRDSDDREDYLEQFSVFAAIYSEIKKKLE